MKNNVAKGNPKTLGIPKTSYSPKTSHFEGFTLVPGEVSLELSPTALHTMVSRQLTTETEISGLFLVQNGVITWLDTVKSVDNYAHTQAGGQEYNRLTDKCLKEMNDVPTGQWHTHPDFNVYWSGEDEGDQVKTVRNNVEEFPAQGEMWFMVADIPEAIIRRFWWENGKVFYQDGVVTVGGVKAEKPKRTWLNYNTNTGMFFAGDTVSFEYEKVRLTGEIEGKVLEGEHKDWYIVFVKEQNLKYHVPKSLLKMEKMYSPEQSEWDGVDWWNLDAWDKTLGRKEPEFAIVEGNYYLFRDFRDDEELVGYVKEVDLEIKACDMMVEDFDQPIFVYFHEIIQEVNP